jgi:hypothetical protein
MSAARSTLINLPNSSEKGSEESAWCAARRESAAKSRDEDDSADTFPTVTTFLVTTKDRY